MAHGVGSWGRNLTGRACLFQHPKPAGSFGRGAEILPDAGGGGSRRGVGEGWVEEAGRNAESADREHAGSRVWSAGVSPAFTARWPRVTYLSSRPRAWQEIMSQKLRHRAWRLASRG